MSRHQSRDCCPLHVNILAKTGLSEGRRREAKYSVLEKRRVEETKYEAGKKRKRMRDRRAARKPGANARARSRAGEVVVGTFNVSTLVVNSTGGRGHAEVIPKICEDVVCGAIGLPEVRRDGRRVFMEAGCVVSFSGADGGKHEKKTNHPVGLAVRESIVEGIEKDDFAVECISARLTKVRL